MNKNMLLTLQIFRVFYVHIFHIFHLYNNDSKYKPGQSKTGWLYWCFLDVYDTKHALVVRLLKLHVRRTRFPMAEQGVSSSLFSFSCFRSTLYLAVVES